MTDSRLPIVDDELELLESLVPLALARIVEPGCGAAQLARRLLQRHPQADVVGLEVDVRQHAKNFASPAPGLTFTQAGAQRIPWPGGAFDGAMMLKSLHHVPVDEMDRALLELARVLRPDGWLYVSEPVYDGALNEIVREYNDEGAVRAAAQRALDRAVASGRWQAADERRFATTVRFRDFDDFERRMMRPTFADHRIDDAMLERVRARYAPHQRAGGATFVRPMHVRLLRRVG
jgi:SAM-dependent methyltransferase